ncbi:IS5 family transposase [Actinomadura bangladeshensis]|uniref:IS5 family transposase n=1 Tax=Actinomadura bangladeshensis TaxID=453573 RepID=A0A6L9Q8X7_9ACTN|nr:IS5 family transposase [Actinomadura bangladeshensis]NEA21950.1 IS5 family transposase [Actinomadura bangladeshensis]
MTERLRYPSDLSDARWELIGCPCYRGKLILTAWRDRRRAGVLDIGRPSEHDLRTIMDAILYVDRTGIPWRYLPHDYPPWQTVYGYFRLWRDDEIFTQISGLLHRLVRVQEGRSADPSGGVIDAQSIKTSSNVPARDQGIDAAKKIVGRKRSSVVDTLGLLLTVLVTAASVQDSVAGTTLIDQIATHHPSVRTTWVDGGYRQHLVEHAATRGIDMQIVQREPRTRGFTPLPRRWVVERTLGWFMLHRRLARDYETLPTSSQAMIHIAAIDLMSRRLTGEATPTWRGT